MPHKANSKRNPLGILLSVLTAVIGLTFVSNIVQAGPTLDPGEVAVSKTAKAVDGKLNTWDIELKIEARDSTKTSDTVLIIDRSGSMTQNGTGGETKMQNAKDAANNFIDALLPADNTTNRIAIVSFAGDVTKEIGFTGVSGKTNLKSKVDALAANGGTYTQLAIHRAQEYIESSTADFKNIVLLSDGEPTYSSKITGLCDNLTGANAWVTGNETNTNVSHVAYSNHTTRVGGGNSGTGPSVECGSWFNPQNYLYNHGNSTIAEAGFAKNSTQHPTLYTVALSAGTTGNNILNNVASPGKAYAGDAASLQAIFDQIAGDIVAAAKNVTISDTIAGQFKIVSYNSTDGVQAGQTITWSNVQLSTPTNGVRSATKTIRIQLADGVDPASLNGQINTNSDVHFKYKDVDGNNQDKTVDSPKVNPVLIHTEKVLVGDKAGSNDQFKIAVTNSSTDYGTTLADSGNFTSTKAVNTGAYNVNETIIGNGQYTTTYEYKIGGIDYMSGNSLNVSSAHQVLTDLSTADNDIYVRVTNHAKLGQLTIHKTLNDCTQGSSTTTSGTTFNFEVKNSAGVIKASPSLTVSKENCHASVTLPNLAQGTYTISELDATDYTTTWTVDGTTQVGKTATVVVGQASSLNRSITFNNRFIVENRTITVNKTWVGGLSSEHSATFELWRDGSKLDGQDKTISGDSSASWTVPSTDIYGVAYTYAVKEANTPANYHVTCSGLSNDKCPVAADGNVSVTNTYTSPKTIFKAYKKWEGGPNEHPTIQFQLYRNDAVYGNAVSLANGTTSYTWSDLDKTDNGGADYVYTVKEVSTPENYTMTQNGNTITNTYVSPKTDITADKRWEGGPNEHPTIQFQLYRNDAVYGNAVSLANGTTSYTWSDLDKTDNGGADYVYTVKEVSTPENYTKSENGLTVTNTYVSPKINISAEKKWQDGPENNRPEIELQLKRNGEAVGSPVVRNANTGWTYTWSNLDKTDNDGADYTYSINEVTVPADYNASYSEDGLTVTNTYVIPTRGEATANKKWLGGPSERPTIQFQLYRNIAGGESIAVPGAGVKTLVSGTDSVTWTGLEQTDIQGNPYTFTVREVETPTNYTKSEDGLTVTNTYVSPKINISAEKKWVGGPDERPTIQFQLYRNDAAYGDSISLEDGMTNYTWGDLDKTDNDGVNYIYRVKEVTVPANYKVSYSEDGLTVTNTYVSPKTDYTVTKIWRGGPAVRPAITVQLYRDGVAYGIPVTLSNGTTSYTWSELDKTDVTGKEYAYTVDEVSTPENYTKYVDGNRITNTYVGEPGRGAGVNYPTVTELPKTGADGGNPLLALLAGLITYLIAYYIQGRRQTNEAA